MRRTRLLFVGLFAFVPVAAYLVAACSDDDSSPSSPSTTTDASPDTATTGNKDGSPGVDGNSPTDSGSDTGKTDSGGDGGGGIQRGPVSLDFDMAGNGDPISMLYDDTDQALYIADNRNDQIWKWTDAAGFTKFALVPDDAGLADAGNANLGQLVRLPDGTFVVPRFGFGTKGGIVYVNPTAGNGGNVPGTAPNKKRTALASAAGSGIDNANNTMFGGYFFNANGDDAGVITKVTLTGETDYAFGFQKPVGTIVLNGNLIVSEQTRGLLYILPTDGGAGSAAPYTVYASVPACDALTHGPGDSLVTGQFRPLLDGGPLQVRQIFSDGGVQVIEADAGLSKPAGVAYDKTNKRLFVADSNGTTIRTIKIFPLE